MNDSSAPTGQSLQHQISGIVTGRVTIALGANSANFSLTPPIQYPNLNPVALVSLGQTAFDATATDFNITISADGKTGTVRSNANATAAVFLNYLIDFRF